MSEEKKGIEFGVDYIGETPIQKHMREEAEFRKLPLLIQDAGDGKWKAFLEAEVPAIVADTEEEFSQKLLEAGLTPERIQELRQEWETNALRQGFSWTLKMEVNPKTGEVKAKSSFSDSINIERGVNSIHREIEKDVPQPGDTILDTNGTTHVVPAENVSDGWGAELPPAEQTPTEQPGIPEDKLREVTVPFPADKIREYFGDKSLFFIANYSESKLKGGAFLTYLSNINIPSDVKFNTPISYEEYAEVMKAYMEQPGVVSAAGLHVMAAEMLLVAKGLPYERSPYALPIDSEVILKFIQEYKYLVENWLHFIDSTQVFALRSIKALNDHYKPEERFPVVEDRSYVGSNIAQLFRIPEFIAVYFAIEGATYKLSYFKDQFEEYMFKNETLAKYFGSHNNFAALYFSHYATGLFKPEDVNHGLFKIGVFDKNSEFYVDVPYEASLQV